MPPPSLCAWSVIVGFWKFAWPSSFGMRLVTNSVGLPFSSPSGIPMTLMLLHWEWPLSCLPWLEGKNCHPLACWVQILLSLCMSRASYNFFYWVHSIGKFVWRDYEGFETVFKFIETLVNSSQDSVWHLRCVISRILIACCDSASWIFVGLLVFLVSGISFRRCSSSMVECVLIIFQLQSVVSCESSFGEKL